MIVVGNRTTQETFQSLSLSFFRSQKYEKRVHRNDKKKLSWDFEKCPGSLYFLLLLIFKPGLYSRAASIIYCVLIVCYLQVITSITLYLFIFHSYFNFGSQSTVNKLPKPLHCCRIHRNSKQFVNSFGIDC